MPAGIEATEPPKATAGPTSWDILALGLAGICEPAPDWPPANGVAGGAAAVPKVANRVRAAKSCTVACWAPAEVIAVSTTIARLLILDGSATSGVSTQRLPLLIVIPVPVR